MRPVVTILDRLALMRNERTHRIRRLPVLVMSPHSRCNCRCVMCDIWRANANGIELRKSDLRPHVDSIKSLRVRMLLLTGGEALMHSNLWNFLDELKPLKLDVCLLTTGLLLKKHAADVAERCQSVIVSLDGSADVHDSIRNIPRAFEKLAAGVKALQEADAGYPVLARSVLQRGNYFDMMNIINAARELRLQQVSFLAADVSSTAFNRPDGWPQDRVGSVALDKADADDFAALLADNRDELTRLHECGFVAESYEKLCSILDYFRALNGAGPFPRVRCNAPWVSAVVETDGTVRPCFFHEPYGNLSDGAIADTINSPGAMQFRGTLDVASNSTCQRCVCSLNL